MNGFIKTSVVGLCLGTGIAAVAGCAQYRQMVDPCWPDRYNAEARLSVRETLSAQAHNGHVLDQTVWNNEFEADTDKLNAAGMEHLKYLARRQPVPDPTVYLQTAQEIPASGTMAPDKLAAARDDLDNKRVAAIQKYLACLTSGRTQGMAYEVRINDLAQPSIAATPIGGAGAQKQPVINGVINQYYQNNRGKMDEKAGVLATGGS